MEKKVLTIRIDEDDLYLVLRAMSQHTAQDVEAMREIALKYARTGEDWRGVIENHDKVMKSERDAYNRLVDQWCEQVDVEDADTWNHLKTCMEICTQNWELYKSEIEKAASERRPVLSIVK